MGIGARPRSGRPCKVHRTLGTQADHRSERRGRKDRHAGPHDAAATIGRCGRAQGPLGARGWRRTRQNVPRRMAGRRVRPGHRRVIRRDCGTDHRGNGGGPRRTAEHHHEHRGQGEAPPDAPRRLRPSGRFQGPWRHQFVPVRSLSDRAATGRPTSGLLPRRGPISGTWRHSVSISGSGRNGHGIVMTPRTPPDAAHPGSTGRAARTVSRRPSSRRPAASWRPAGPAAPAWPAWPRAASPCAPDAWPARRFPRR